MQRDSVPCRGLRLVQAARQAEGADGIAEGFGAALNRKGLDLKEHLARLSINRLALTEEPEKITGQLHRNLEGGRRDLQPSGRVGKERLLLHYIIEVLPAVDDPARRRGAGVDLDVFDPESGQGRALFELQPGDSNLR